jgi:hypothetical protein
MRAPRFKLGTDALMLITPDPNPCAVVIASVPGYPTRLTDARTELDRESVEAGDSGHIAYSVNQAAGALGLSKQMIYDQLWANRLGSVKVGKRRIMDAWLALTANRSSTERSLPTAARTRPSRVRFWGARWERRNAVRCTQRR